MTEKLNVLVIGATGQQGGGVARQLLSRGHNIRAFTRNADSAAAQELVRLGAKIAVGNHDDGDSLRQAAEGVDAVYSMTTFFEAGIEAETRQGKAVADAAKAANVPYFVYSSVGGADQATGIPHFDSKFLVEEHIKSIDLPYAIIAPVYFMDNVKGPWSLPAVAQGTLAMPLPANRTLQQVSVSDVASFSTYVLEHRDEFLGKRLDYASDETTGVQAAQILTRVTGRQINYVSLPLTSAYEMSEDIGKMYEWFDTIGYSTDIDSLRAQYPEVGWQGFEEWVSAQDWSALAADGGTTQAA